MSGSVSDPVQLRRARLASVADATTLEQLLRIGAAPSLSGPDRDRDVILFTGCLVERRLAIRLAFEWADPAALQEALAYPHSWDCSPDPLVTVRHKLADLLEDDALTGQSAASLADLLDDDSPAWEDVEGD